MRKLALLGAALVLTSGTAMAQVFEITPEEERTVYSTITRERVTGPAIDLDVNVGTVLPESVELYEVPDTVAVAPVRRYQYVVIDDRVVLVEPRSRRVVRVIRER